MEKPTLAEAIDHLQHIESFQVVHEHIGELYEDLIRELPEVPADKLQMHTGRIITYKEILDLIENR